MDFFMNPGLKVEAGWVKVHRKIREHWIWEPNKTYSKFQAWIDIILQANHEGKKILLGNELIFVKRGSFISSIRKLGDKWHWSRTKVIKFLKSLQSDSMLIVKSDTKKTVLTIANYDVYQDVKIEKKPQKSHKKATEVTRKSLNKNDKELKNEKKVQIIIDFLNKIVGTKFKFAEGNKRNIRARFKDGYTIDEMKTVIEYKYKDWLNTEWSKYLNPITLFRPSKFDGYLQDAIKNHGIPIKRKQFSFPEDSGVPLTTQEQIRDRDKK